MFILGKKSQFDFPFTFYTRRESDIFFLDYFDITS